MTATPVVSVPVQAKAGQRVKLTGAGFKAGTRVDILFDARPRALVGSATARANGTFATSVVVPHAGPGKHKLQVVGTSEAGAPASLPAPMLLVANETSLPAKPTSSLAAPVLLTLAVVIPFATWLTLEVLGWRHRRSGRQGTAT